MRTTVVHLETKWTVIGQKILRHIWHILFFFFDDNTIKDEYMTGYIVFIYFRLFSVFRFLGL